MLWLGEVMASRNRKTRRAPRRRPIELPPPPRAQGPRRRRAGLVLFGVSLLVLVNLYVFLWSQRSVVNVYRQARVQNTTGVAGASSPEAASGAASSGAQDRSLTNLRLPQSITAAALEEEEDEALLEVEAYTVHGTIRRGDNLYGALNRVGVNRLLGDVVVRSLEHLYDFRRARPGQKFSVKLSQDRQRMLAFEFQASAGEIFRIGREGKKLVGKRVHRPVVTRVFEMVSTVHGSLWATIQGMGEDGRLLASVVAVFSWDLNMYSDIKKGDVLRLVVEKEYQGDDFLRYGRVLAAEYQGQRKRLQAFWYRAPQGAGGYYDAQGRSLHRLLLKAPLRYNRVSSPFDLKRLHPILKRVRPHLGVDYAAPTGTPIWAMGDGEVTFLGRNRAAGNMVVLEHEGGIRTVYMHMHSFRQGLKKGDKVRQRELIGTVGSTGMSTGPHLHLGLKVGGVYVDPQNYDRARRSSVSPQHRSDFQRSTAPLLNALRSLTPDPRPRKVEAGKEVTAVSQRYRER